MKRIQYILSALMVLLLLGCKPAPEPADTAPLVSGSATAQTAQDTEAIAPLPDDALYTLISEESELTYGAYRLTGKGHTGTVEISEGALTRADGAFTGGEFIIDMTTITESNNNERFLGHVRNEDFFDVAKHPTSKIVLENIEGEDGEYLITGDLTILDQTHELTFPATLQHTANGLEISAAFEIDRTRWGIIYDSGSFISDLGDRAIKDEIEYELDLVLKEN